MSESLSRDLPAAPQPVAETPASVPPVADGVERHLDPRQVELQRVVGWIVAAFAWAIAMVVLPMVMLLAGWPLWLDLFIAADGLAVLFALTWSAHFWPPVEHRYAAYRVGMEGIEIRRGVLWRHVITVPRTRIQHTDVSQGPLQRRFGLGTLTIFTAGTEHEKVDLPGLDHQMALAIRDALVPGGHDDAI